MEEWCADDADDATELRLNMAENTPPALALPVLLPGDDGGDKFLLVLLTVRVGDDPKAWRGGVGTGECGGGCVGCGCLDGLCACSESPPRQARKKATVKSPVSEVQGGNRSGTTTPLVSKSSSPLAFS